MIIEFDSKKARTTSPHYLSGNDGESTWRITLVDGLNEVSDDLVANLRKHDNLKWYLDQKAILFREDATTPFQRRAELEAIFERQGYRPISELAAKYNIPKPVSGWRDAITQIIEYEGSELAEIGIDKA